MAETAPARRLAALLICAMLAAAACSSTTRKTTTTKTTTTKTTTPTTPKATHAPVSTAPTGGDRTPSWHPTPGTTWQWQLTVPVDPGVDAQVYDIDGFENSASVVAALHTRGRKVICYLDTGAREPSRPDAGDFPSKVLGRSVEGYPEERWLDIRRLDVLAPIMRARLDMCQEKGFDGVEFDLADGYEADTGFPLKPADQLAWNRFLATEAHLRGMAAGLKNDLGQVRLLVDLYDFSVNEQCWEYSECDALLPFVKAGKAVFHAEYSSDPLQYCPALGAQGFSSIKKRVDLGVYRSVC